MRECMLLPCKLATLQCAQRAWARKHLPDGRTYLLALVFNAAREGVLLSALLS